MNNRKISYLNINPTLCLCASVAILFSAMLSFPVLLFSQDTGNTGYALIKQLIQTKQLSKAREELRLAMIGNENDPTLNLYQTELWIMEGDSFNASGQYKKALEIYEKAIQYYPSNPMVKLKYEEMVNKMKTSKMGVKENQLKEPIPIQPLGLQGNFPPNSDSSENSTALNLSLSRTDFLLTLICIQNFILLLFLFYRLPKKE